MLSEHQKMTVQHIKMNPLAPIVNVYSNSKAENTAEVFIIK